MTAFTRLLHQLPSLARAPIQSWDAMAFLRWLCSTGLSHGELLAGRLALSVWNPSTDWVAEARSENLPTPEAAARFDLLDAATVWDQAHLQALVTWLTSRDKFP